jgi:serine/threonine protein kinase
MPGLRRRVERAGVIFYELLYGRRPFHAGVSQEAIARSNLLLQHAPLTFDASPRVSQEAKDFIAACLTYNHHQRPSVAEARAHPYLNPPARDRRRSGSQAVNTAAPPPPGASADGRARAEPKGAALVSEQVPTVAAGPWTSGTVHAMTAVHGLPALADVRQLEGYDSWTRAEVL